MARTDGKRDLKRKAGPEVDAPSKNSDAEQTVDLPVRIDVNAETVSGTDYSNEFRIKVVGGHRLTTVRPQFTENDHLMVPDEHRVLMFSTKTKEIAYSLSPAAEGDRITNVILHPYLPNFQMFAFAVSGNVYLCNYLDGSTTANVRVPFTVGEIGLDLNQERSLAWATCRNYRPQHQTSGDNYLVLFYAVHVIDRSDDSSWYELYSCPFHQPSQAGFLLRSNIFSEQRITFGPQNQYLVFIERSRCFMLMLDEGRPSALSPDPILLFKRRNKTHFRHYNGVACSSTEHLLANSDEGGQIYLHHLNPDDLAGKHPKSLLHWHPMAVCDMCFSPNGTYLYSVGSEGVVVRWTLATLQRNFCARVGYGIRFVMANGSDVAITLQNNIIRLISSHFSDLEGELSTLMFYEHQQFTSGLIYNSKMQAIALNGRPGFIQFFNPLQPGQLQVLDVTQSNYIEPIGGVDQVFNIDVHQVACTVDGIWMATFELRDDQRTLPEMRLKFWRFNKQSHKAHHHLAKFEVHTVIHLPHKERITEMKFAPTTRLFVTAGMDQQFKLWTQASGNEKWFCLQTVMLNSSIRPICVDFSSDSSALSVAYDNTVTIWNLNKPDEISLIDSIVYEAKIHKLGGVHFGTKSCAHLLTLVTDRNVMLWELPNMRCIWTWNVGKSSILKHTFDFVSNRLILLTSCGQITVISLSSIDATVVGNVRLKKPITAEQVESMILYPHNCAESADPLFGRFLLCFLTNSKQMFAFENANFDCIHSKAKTISPADIETNTKGDAQFTFLDTLARRKQGDVDAQLQPKLNSIKYSFSQLNTAKLIDEMFFNVPSHVLPPIEMMSKTFLQSLQVGGIPLDGDQNRIKKEPQTTKLAEIQEKTKEFNTIQSKATLADFEECLNGFPSIEKMKKFNFKEDYSFLRARFQ